MMHASDTDMLPNEFCVLWVCEQMIGIPLFWFYRCNVEIVHAVTSSCNRKCNLCNERWMLSWNAAQMLRKRFMCSNHLIVSERRQAYRVYRKTNKLLQILLNLFGFYRLRRVSLQTAHHNVCIWRKSFDFDFPACFWLCEWLGKCAHTHTYWFSHTRASVSRFTVCDSKVFISRPLTIPYLWCHNNGIPLRRRENVPLILSLFFAFANRKWN